VQFNIFLTNLLVLLVYKVETFNSISKTLKYPRVIKFFSLMNVLYTHFSTLYDVITFVFFPK
jgi:hypothetical protein